MPTIHTLPAIAASVVGPAAVEVINDHLVVVDWEHAGRGLFALQSQLMKSLSLGGWWIDLEDPPQTGDVRVVGRGEMGTLVFASDVGLSTDLFKELGRQAWLGLTGAAPPVVIRPWSITDLFTQPDQFTAILTAAQSAGGIVTYHDSAAWLLARLPEPADKQVRRP